MNTKLLTALSAIFVSSHSMAAHSIPDSLFLKCQAKKFVSEQPCGGQNSKDLKLFFSVDGSFKDSGYKLKQTYGGCYSTEKEHFGVVHQVVLTGQKVHFTLRYVGSMSIGGIPAISVEQNEIYEIDAAYDLNTKKLELDLGKGRGQYMEPRVLECGNLLD